MKTGDTVMIYGQPVDNTLLEGYAVLLLKNRIGIPLFECWQVLFLWTADPEAFIKYPVNRLIRKPWEEVSTYFLKTHGLWEGLNNRSKNV